MKWLEKVCNVLENQKFKNTKDGWILKDRKGKPVMACALGELFLASNLKQKSLELGSDYCRRSLVKYYRVPKKIVTEVFTKINSLNCNGKSKKHIAKLLKKKYKN